MGLMSSGDWSAMAADLQSIRDDNPVSLVIRRGGTSLAAQTVRIAGKKFRASPSDSTASEQVESSATLVGATTLDIQANDRFTTGGVLYEVLFVEGNRLAGVRAQLRVVE